MSSFEFCADGFVDDTDDGQTFNFGKNFSEKLFKMLLDQIECDRKNCFIPLNHFRNNLSFTYINTFSKKSTQDEFGSN